MSPWWERQGRGLAGILLQAAAVCLYAIERSFAGVQQFVVLAIANLCLAGGLWLLMQEVRRPRT